jgi:hypothetical protein
MAEITPAYSTLMQCLHDQAHPVVPHYGHYSVFRAIDARDVTQKPTSLPRVHDFAVIWDDDHDSRIIPVIEEMLMAGLLPGVQFVGEHKGTLTVILAARTYWEIDLDAFKTKVASLTQAAGDFWDVRVGMFDHSPHSLRTGHQCDFQEIIGLSNEATHAYLLAIDGMWNLGTKEWRGLSTPTLPLPPETFFSPPNRYIVASTHRRWTTAPVSTPCFPAMATRPIA